MGIKKGSKNKSKKIKKKKRTKGRSGRILQGDTTLSGRHTQTHAKYKYVPLEIVSAHIIFFTIHAWRKDHSVCEFNT